MLQIPEAMAAIARRHGGPNAGDIAARMRPPEVCLTSKAMDAQKATRLSFTQSLGRKMIRERWKLTKNLVEFDADGVGRAIYDLDLAGVKSTYIVQSFATDGKTENQGRRAGAKRDLWGALFLGRASADRIAEEFAVIETRDAKTMRARSDLIGWTPGSRSARVFDEIVGALASGRQPAADVVRKSGYIIRNGGFVASGRYGTCSYAGIPADHPLKSPYYADLLGLLAMREVGVDLVNSMAAARSPDAVMLSEQHCRYFGVGNASGQGMCVALQRWPQWVSTWILAREFCLARALLVEVDVAAPERERMVALLTRAIHYYGSVVPELEEFMVPHWQVAANLSTVRDLVRDDRWFRTRRWDDLARHVAGTVDKETAEVFNALLIEIYPAFADDVADYIPTGMNMPVDFSPETSVGEYRRRYLSRYGWHLRLDIRLSDARRHFWYHSIENGEQRRGERVIDPHENFESFIDVIGAIQRLASVLSSYDDETPMALVVADFPDLAYVVARLQSMAGRPYKEIHDNLLAKDFRPSHLIRFYLAILGLEFTYPLSVRWVPGVLFQGFPTWREVAAGTTDDWKFVGGVPESELA